MEALTNEVLMETYINAIQFNLEAQFIQLLEDELNRRGSYAIFCN